MQVQQGPHCVLASGQRTFWLWQAPRRPRRLAGVEKDLERREGSCCFCRSRSSASAAPLGHKVALLSFTRSLVLQSDCDIPPSPASPSLPLPKEGSGEAGREGRRVGGFTDVSWRPQRGAPLSPGRPGLPGPRSGCCQAPDLLVVLARPLSWGLGLCFLNGAEAVTRASSADPPAPPEWPAPRASDPRLLVGGPAFAHLVRAQSRAAKGPLAGGCLESPTPSSWRGPRTHPDPHLSEAEGG